MPQLKIPAWPSVLLGQHRLVTREAVAAAGQTVSECVRSGEHYSHFLKSTPAFGSVHHGNYAQVDWASWGSTHGLGWWIALASFCWASAPTWTQYSSLKTVDGMAMCWSKASVNSFIKGLGRCSGVGGLSGITAHFWAFLNIMLLFIFTWRHTDDTLWFLRNKCLHFIKTQKNLVNVYIHQHKFNVFLSDKKPLSLYFFTYSTSQLIGSCLKWGCRTDFVTCTQVVELQAG